MSEPTGGRARPGADGSDDSPAGPGGTDSGTPGWSAGGPTDSGAPGWSAAGPTGPMGSGTPEWSAAGPTDSGTPAWSAPGAGGGPSVPAWDGSSSPAWGATPSAGSQLPAWGAAAPGWGAPPPVAPRPGVVPLRPLGLGELLDGAVGLVRSHPGPTLGASALVALVSTVVELVLLLTLLRPLFDYDLAALEAGDPAELVGLLTSAAGGLSVRALLGVVTGAVLAGCLSAVAGRAVLGQPFGVADLRSALRGKVLRLVGAALLVQLLAFGPLVLAGLLVAGLAASGGAAAAAFAGLLLVPAATALGVYLYVRLTLVPSVVVLEDAGIGTAFRRSGVLVRRSFWRVLGVMLLTVVVGAVAAEVLQLPFTLFAGADGLPGLPGAANPLSTRDLVLASIGAGLASTVVNPFVAGVQALLYVDRRMRAEGLDIALQAAARTGA